MSFDGVFIHHLTDELKNILINSRIKKLISIDKNNFVFELSNYNNLLINASADAAHFRLIETDYLQSKALFPFFNSLKKHLETGLIVELYQVQNDRIIVFTIEQHDSLGYKTKTHLICEMFGRNTNLILTNEEFIVIDCLNKTYVLSENKKRIMVPKINYTFPIKDDINPFKTNLIYEQNIYQGVSKILYKEIIETGDISFIKSSTKPTLITQDNKTFFYCFDLKHIPGERTYFPNLSSLLDTYYHTIRKINIKNTEQKLLETYLKKETHKAYNKLKKQKEEYQAAILNLGLEQIGNLLSANLQNIKKNATEITVFDFYNNNNKTINLDPFLTPAQNMELVFSKYKKAKRTINHLKEQIISTENEISYLQTIEEQITILKAHELKEVVNELDLIKKKPQLKKPYKPQITTFKTNNNSTIFVGKNNIQNNYLTHKLAARNDLFFHVRGAPGSHTILKGEIQDPDTIKLAAIIAAYYSKVRLSENIPVDYTLVKYVKRVPKTKGSFVIYNNQKTIFVTPDLDFIKDNTT